MPSLPGLVIGLVILSGLPVANAAEPLRIAVVSSYHPEYQWSQGTNEGLTRGLIDFGYLDNAEQAQIFSEQDQLRNARIDIRKYWMDTKHKSSEAEIADTLVSIVARVDEFAPDILLLGDDNAANYVGNYYLDTALPIVFWGVNGTPLKYGLLDSIEQPGHNVTGIYQKNYYQENIELLKRLAPEVRTLAVLSDDSATGRAHSKLFRQAVTRLNDDIKLLDVVNTNDFEHWKQRALTLSDQVDAFLISTLYTLRDNANNAVTADEVLRWYLKHIRKPEVVAPINLVRRGMLATVFDSPYNQGYETARVTHQILSGTARPATISPYAPEHGGYVVNRWRATQLGLQHRLTDNTRDFHELIDEHVDLD
jgi:ABC-type uncharacterized transport system substrate-binding protein